MTSPWEKYYHVTSPGNATQPGAGHELWTVQRDEGSEWFVAKPDRGVATVELRHHQRTSRYPNPNVVYTVNPEPSEDEKKALVLAVTELTANRAPRQGGAYPQLPATGGLDLGPGGNSSSGAAEAASGGPGPNTSFAFGSGSPPRGAFNNTGSQG